ncbi:SPOR domain-containing protein [Oleidesulfovibrio sp.]|uniref:SPOR domain-containing protein n=1 Tax=Oleidesulfovibrio sp. TaxID=2909707 RepID=UPI003A84E5D6
MTRFTRILIFIAFAIILSGCKQDAKNYWKDTRKLYREYVNTPATLDNNEELDVMLVESKIATVFTSMDEQLEQMRRVLDNQDTFPSDEWIAGFLERFPWVSGVAVVDTDGTVLLQQPQLAIKPYNYNPLLEASSDTPVHVMRGYAEANPLGPEFYLANPMVAGRDISALLIAHFDVRNLLAFCPSPGDIVVLSRTDMLWPGKYVYDKTPLAGVDWAEKLKTDVMGEVEDDRGSFLWIARYLGGIPIVYAASVDQYPEDPANLAGLAAWFETREALRNAPAMEETEVDPVALAARGEIHEDVVVESEPVSSGNAPERVTPGLHDQPTAAPATDDFVYSVQIGAFINEGYAKDRVELLRKAGFEPCTMKLYDKDGQLWNIVQIGDYRTSTDAWKRVREFINADTGFDYNIEFLDAGVVSRRKQCP